MSKISEILTDIVNIEKFAENDTFIHVIDPRCKILLTIFFCLFVISFNKYETIRLLPYFAFPAFTIIVSEIPLPYLLKKIAVVSTFALAIAVVNPFIDRNIVTHIASLPISGGWLSFISIMIRFYLTASVSILLLITTGMYDISKGLNKLGIPCIFTNQLFFLSRYIVALTEDASKIERGRAARSFGRKGREITVFNHLISTLFMRSLERSERIYRAMKCRGFNGSIETLHKMRWKNSDTIFLISWITFFLFFKIVL
jgi:cobalt/nickel transport system permease protein